VQDGAQHYVPETLDADRLEEIVGEVQTETTVQRPQYLDEFRAIHVGDLAAQVTQRLIAVVRLIAHYRCTP